MDCCLALDCASFATRLGYCSAHFHRLQRYGDPNYRPPRAKDAECIVEGCPQPGHSRGWCRQHYERWRKYGVAEEPFRHTPKLIEKVDRRVCTKCLEDRALEDFPDNSRAPQGKDRVCRVCRSLQNRISKAKAAYGEEGVKILVRIDAGEGCETCGGRTTRMAIDHNHKTGVTRGLLCSNCNTALGLLRESPDTINRLLAYLTIHEAAIR